MTFQTGQTIGDYTVLGLVANRTATEIYRVEHTITRRLEAMKILPGDFADGGDQAERFMRQIQLQASLNHPNIASVHNAFWANDDLVLVMELVEGEPLDRVLQRGRLPLQQAIEFMAQTLSALNHAHLHGIVHRAVNPSNIIITPQQKVKLTEFGLAKTAGDFRTTRVSAVRPSMRYSSPEQIRKGSAVDPRSDIYSCGVVLYELVTGRRPFSAEETSQLLEDQASRVPVPPADVNLDVPRQLSDCIMTALEKDPDRRFQSAESFKLALENCALPTPRETVEFVRKRPVLPGKKTLLFSITGALIAAVVVLLFLWRAGAIFAPPVHAKTMTKKTVPVAAQPVPQPQPAVIVAPPKPAVQEPQPPEPAAAAASLPLPQRTAKSGARSRTRKPVQQGPVAAAESTAQEPAPPPETVAPEVSPAAHAAVTAPVQTAPTPKPPPAASSLVPPSKTQQPVPPSASAEATKAQHPVRRFFGKILHPKKKEDEPEKQ